MFIKNHEVERGEESGTSQVYIRHSSVNHIPRVSHCNAVDDLWPSHVANTPKVSTCVRTPITPILAFSLWINR